MLDEVILSKDRLLLVGDFNFHSDNTMNSDTVLLNSILQSYGLTQHISEPTHVKGHTLDLVLSRSVELLVSAPFVHNTLLSDHYWVRCDLLINKPGPVQREITFRKIKDIDPIAFGDDITSSVLASPNTFASADDLVDSYNKVLTTLLEKHAPQKTKKFSIHPKSPWFNSTIGKAKRERRKAERKWRKTKLTIDKEIFRESHEQVITLINEAKKDHYQSKVKNAKDQKALFKVVNTLFNHSKDLSLPQHESSQILANKFNEFFVQKIAKIRQELILISDKTSSSNHISASETPSTLSEFEPASEEEVKRIIMSSKSKYCIQDPIPTTLLKDCLEPLLPCLTQIINLSLSQGVMPASLKKSLVVPLLKKANLDVEAFKNFRPVSNLAYLSKTVERLIAKRLKKHMDANMLHEPLQSAYKEFHSCETALLRVQNDILMAVDGKKCVLLILLDLSAAFDTVDYHKLFSLLANRIGLSGKALEWFVSYLSDRIQSVLIDGVASEIWNIIFGVPQGSVLGPILFIIYTSPLGDILRRHGVLYHLYADDSQLYISFDLAGVQDALEKMEKCIAEIKTWMADNILCLNDSKTEVMLLGSKHMLKQMPTITVTVGNDNITPTDVARNIGVIFDSNMSMEKQVNNICKSAWHHLRNIGQNRHFLDNNSAERLVHAFVSSKLDNMNSLLVGIPKRLRNKLQRVQNAAARIITRTKKYEHITPVLVNLHWLPIKQRIDYKIALITFKALHGKAPAYITELLQTAPNTRNLRSNDQHLLQCPRTSMVSYGDRSFAHVAPSLWNKLPFDIRSADSLDSFKSKLKTHLFLNAYDVTE